MMFVDVCCMHVCSHVVCYVVVRSAVSQSVSLSGLTGLLGMCLDVQEGDVCIGCSGGGSAAAAAEVKRTVLYSDGRMTNTKKWQPK